MGQDAINALKRVISTLSSLRITYNEIANQTYGDFAWTGNAIKQFIHRHSEFSRINDRHVHLAHVVVTICDRHYEAIGDRLPSSDLKSINSLLDATDPKVTTKAEDLSKDVGERIRNLRRASSTLVLPAQFAFVRYGRKPTNEPDHRFMIVLLVQCKQSSDGYTFSMKIQGKSQRVVIGGVTRTNNAIYFNGIAYRYIGDTSEFAALDCMNLNKLNQNISLNEVGMENFSVAVHHLSAPIAPTCFLGLDGLGYPISGIGAMIDPSVFSEFKIDTSDLSYLKCVEENSEMQKMLDSEAIGASTTYPELRA